MTGFKKKVQKKYSISSEIKFKVFLSDIRSIGYDIDKTKIISFAYQRKDALRKLKDLHLQITDHLIKLLVLPESSAVAHWKAELAAWQETLHRLNKGRQKSGTNFSDKILNDWLWDFPLGTEGDREEALKCLKKKGYAVPDKMDTKMIADLKKKVDCFITDILK